MNHKKTSSKKAARSIMHNRTFLLALVFAIVVPSVVAAFLSVQMVYGASGQITQGAIPAELLNQYGMGLLGAAIAVAGSCLGAGIAIYGAASAGAAAMAERPETSIWVLILAGLGEGVAIYGLLIAILILGKLPTVA